MVGLLASTLSAMWNLLAYSFSAGKGLELEQMQATALLLKRVLRKGPPISDAFTCAACGALSVLPAAALPAGISPLLTALLPDATGRSLEAIATLLAALVSGATPGNIYMCVCVSGSTPGAEHACSSFISPISPRISPTSPLHLPVSPQAPSTSATPSSAAAARSWCWTSATSWSTCSTPRSIPQRARPTQPTRAMSTPRTSRGARCARAPLGLGLGLGLANPNPNPSPNPTLNPNQVRAHAALAHALMAVSAHAAQLDAAEARARWLSPTPPPYLPVSPPYLARTSAHAAQLEAAEDLAR